MSLNSHCHALHLFIYELREPRDHDSNSNDQPDIVVFDSHSSCDIDLDILSQAAHEDGIAVVKGETSKNKKYSSELNMQGNPPYCIPLVFERLTIRDGRQTNSFINYLSIPQMKMERKASLN